MAQTEKVKKWSVRVGLAILIMVLGIVDLKLLSGSYDYSGLIVPIILFGIGVLMAVELGFKHFLMDLRGRNLFNKFLDIFVALGSLVLITVSIGLAFNQQIPVVSQFAGLLTTVSTGIAVIELFTV